MKRLLPFLVVFNFCFAQNQKLGVVVDAVSQTPVPFVDVFNQYDNTLTNTEGRYFIFTVADSLTFRKIGYKKTTVHFSDLKDTLRLAPSPLELEEVILTNTKSLWDKVRDSLASNYKLSPFKERFFLRCILRKNGAIVRLQDIAGKIRRETMLYKKGMPHHKSDFQFEVSHMRKIGVEKDENDVYFTFFSLSELLFETIRLNATGPGFLLKEQLFEDENKAKITFQTDSTAKYSETSGHYIINTRNNAIESVVLKSKIDGEKYFKNGPIRSRTIGRDQRAFFSKSPEDDHYFQSLSTITYSVEITSVKKSFRDIYSSEYILKTYDHDGAFDFSKNTNAKRDIFKLKHPYDPRFWQDQNYLLLTSEMETFIRTIGKGDGEFKIRTNLNN